MGGYAASPYPPAPSPVRGGGGAGFRGGRSATDNPVCWQRSPAPAAPLPARGGGVGGRGSPVVLSALLFGAGALGTTLLTPLSAGALRIGDWVAHWFLVVIYLGQPWPDVRTFVNRVGSFGVISRPPLYNLEGGLLVGALDVQFWPFQLITPVLALAVAAAGVLWARAIGGPRAARVVAPLLGAEPVPAPERGLPLVQDGGGRPGAVVLAADPRRRPGPPAEPRSADVRAGGVVRRPRVPGAPDDDLLRPAHPALARLAPTATAVPSTDCLERHHLGARRAGRRRGVRPLAGLGDLDVRAQRRAGGESGLVRPGRLGDVRRLAAQRGRGGDRDAGAAAGPRGAGARRAAQRRSAPTVSARRADGSVGTERLLAPGPVPRSRPCAPRPSPLAPRPSAARPGSPSSFSAASSVR